MIGEVIAKSLKDASYAQETRRRGDQERAGRRMDGLQARLHGSIHLRLALWQSLAIVGVALLARGLPSEIQTFVTAINRLLAHVQQAMAVQRRFTADAAHGRQQQGSDLGLSIAQAVVQRLGGRIEIDGSTFGRGLCVTVTLPPAVRLTVPRQA